jgi:hypothetical protein
VSQLGITARCSTWARQVGLSPIATVGTYTGFLLAEIPLPWPRDVSELPELADVAAWAGPAGIRLQALVPANPNAPAEDRRVILHYRPPTDPAFRGYHRYETTTGRSLAESARALLACAVAGSDQLAVPGTDVLVCTHGRRDVCCGSMGTDLALELAAAPPVAPARPGMSIWRTSHTGGHRFAPTFLVLPEATGWAFADADLVAQVLARSVSFADVASRYRGCAGLADRRLQVLEREVLCQAGWQVLDQPRTGLFEGATTQLTVGDDTNGRSMWEAEVVAGRTLQVPECQGPTAGKTETELVGTDLRPALSGRT